MSSETPDDPRSTAIDALRQLGLSTYAARTYVALVSLGTGTAKDVSEVVDVPRTRVYDATEELAEMGLVDVKQSSPREFWAVSAETTSRTFEEQYRHHTQVLTDALTDLEPVERRDEQRGVWTVDGRDTVTDRVLEFIAGADDEIIFMSVEDVLTDDVVDALASAADRGVSVKLGGGSPALQAEIEEAVPAADRFDSLWVWSDTPASRLLFVDREQTLVSVLVDDGGDGRTETAIWGSGEANSLVVVLRGIFTWRLDDLEAE
jgi:sugar-specific transcriptional regulator TrmB